MKTFKRTGRGIRLRTLLVVAMVGVIVMVVGATVFGLRHLLAASADKQLEATVTQAIQALEALQRLREDRTVSDTRLIVEEPRLRAALATPDVTPETVLDIVRDLVAAIGSDVFVIVDHEGNVVADPSGDRATGLSLADDPVVARSFASGSHAGTWTVGARASHVQGRRVTLGDQVLGVVVIGRHLAPDLAAVHRHTGSHVALMLEDRVLAKSPAMNSVPTVTSDSQEIEVDGTWYQATRVVIADVQKQRLAYLILSDRDRARAAMEDALGLVYVIALLGVLLGCITAVMLSRRLTRQLDGVVEMAEAVAAGDRERQAPQTGPAELQLLGRAIDHMVAELRSLHQGLEQRVDERTAELVVANVSLEREMTSRLQTETELRQAQKLEAVGRLASGVAHEINTPVQFVSDSLHFLRDATTDLVKVIESFKPVQEAVLAGAPALEAATKAEQVQSDADLEYLVERVPKAFERSLEGLDRVAKIVRSMKVFAHPDSTEASAIDLNAAIESTLVIARNEYKYIADVECSFGDLPAVRCFAGDFNQVVLNVVVNAAHAIGDVVQGTEARGKITVATRIDGDDVVISISDTGGGIPEAIRARIFDPFFTTKEVGKGTGQGLAISRSVVVDKHGGTIEVESEPSRGTTFHLRIPVDVTSRVRKAA